MYGTTISERLDAMADKIEKGWCQGRSEMSPGTVNEKVCVMGAIGRLGLDLDANFLMTDIIKDYLNVHSISNWNDAPGRTKEEVVQMLRDCAIKNRPDAM